MNWEVPRRCALLLLGALSSGCCTGGDALSIAAVELTLLDPITGGNVCDAVVVAEDWVRRPRPPVGADMKRTARSALWVCAALAILLAVWVYSRLPAAGDVRPTGSSSPASTVRLVPAPSPAQATPQMDIVPHTGNAAADRIGELVLGGYLCWEGLPPKMNVALTAMGEHDRRAGTPRERTPFDGMRDRWWFRACVAVSPTPDLPAPPEEGAEAGAPD